MIIAIKSHNPSYCRALMKLIKQYREDIMGEEKKPSPKTKVKVTYSGGIDVALDNRIITEMESAGCRWYGQGMEMVPPYERDIVFDFPEG